MKSFVSAAHYYHLQLDPEQQRLTYIILQKGLQIFTQRIKRQGKVENNISICKDKYINHKSKNCKRPL